MDSELDSINDLQKLCRLCMESGLELYSIYDLTPLNDVGIHIQFVEMIMGCTSLKIKSGDGLPEAICMQCVNYLGECYSFKQRCEKSDRKLKELLHMLKENKKAPIEEPEEDDDHFDDDVPMDARFDMEIRDIKEENDSVDSTDDFELENDSTNAKEKKIGEMVNLDDTTATKTKKDVQKKTKSKVQKKNRATKSCEDLRDKNVTCTFCFKQFKTEVNLKLHKKACQTRTTRCALCSQNFPSTNLLKDHLGEVHSIVVSINEDEIHTCDICGAVFSDHNKLLFHFKNHIGVVGYYHDEHDETSMICCHCDMRFTKVVDLETHFNGHKTDESSFTCRLCSFKTLDDQSVKNHLKTHGVSSLVCNICWLSFLSNRKFRIHLRTHKPVVKSSFSCLICNERFSSKFDIKKHLPAHLKSLQSCTPCSKSFMDASEYESHQMEHAKSVLCTICGKLFPGRSVLESHMLIHEGVKPFTCSICNQSFRTKHILKGHERVHSDAKPYVCTWCGYSCKRSGDLYIHHRIHTGDRPYSCSFPGCNSTFKTSSFMNQHLKRHTGEGKAHTCELCTKIFSSSTALKRHMLIHNNEKPHECDICGKCFRRKHHLKGHKAKIHRQ